MKSIQEILMKFSYVQLDELAGASLMDRVETKFWFKEQELYLILDQVCDTYDVLEIEKKQIHHYQSEYFDTLDRSLYLDHHNGRLNRFKIRTRYYTESQIGFFEIKHKNNKGRTKKIRIEHPYAYGPLTANALQLIKDQNQSNLLNLQPSLRIEYDRFTLVSKDKMERVTIDLNLQFLDGNLKVEIPNLSIAEIKQQKRNMSKFLLVMKKLGHKEGSLSKYCIGMALTQKDIKRNNFRNKLRYLEKICY